MKIIARFIILMCCTFIGLIAVTTWDAKAAVPEDMPEVCVPFVDEQRAITNHVDAVHQETIRNLIDQLYARDVKYVTDMNARWQIMQDQRAEIFNLRAKVERKEALIQELRAKVRKLQGR